MIPVLFQDLIRKLLENLCNVCSLDRKYIIIYLYQNWDTSGFSEEGGGQQTA